MDSRPIADETDRMNQTKHDVNSITVGAMELLLTAAGGGSAVHLAALAKSAATARSAVPELCFAPDALRRRPGLANYDSEALGAARWSQTTLCGRIWSAMVGGDGGPIRQWSEEPVFAPTCKRCLTLLDRMFPPPSVHPRLPMIAQIVADSVATRGYAEVCEVPGDQQTELRRQIRFLVRQKTAHGCQTLVHDSMVFVVCQPIAESRREEHMHEVAQRLQELWSGESIAPAPDPEWRHYWSTWATD
jgi:hypothetical protein